MAAERLLACALEDLADWPGKAVVAPASAADADWFRGRLAERLETVVQHGGSLGARINHIDTVLRASGSERLIYIGADCPALNSEYLARADSALADNDAVIGPATDGGVVLMGARRPWPRLDDLPWSTSELREALCGRLHEQRWTIARLGTLSDVDTVEDLSVTCDMLTGDDRLALRELVHWWRANFEVGAAVS